MGIGCFSLQKQENNLRKHPIHLRKPSVLLHYNSVPLLTVPSLERYRGNQNGGDERPTKDSGNNGIGNDSSLNENQHSGILADRRDIESKNNYDHNISQRPLLPNLPYSPFTSPNMSPVHRLRPNGTHHSHSYNNNLSSLQQERRSTSISDTPGAITQLKQYHIREQLGQGSYGLVQLAYNQENSTYYAMKSLSKKKLMKSSGLFNRPMPLRMSTSSASSIGKASPQETVDPLQKIYKEIAIHKKLCHPNIVKLIEVLDDPSQEFLYMVFEYVENGAVMHVGRDPPFSESRARKYFIDALLGLEYLHYQKIAHRDIKPANLLLSQSDQIKIADFGVSNEFTGDDVYLSTTAGSPAFMAPESVRHGPKQFTGKALDIWALGVTLYAFLFAKIPFEHCNRYLLYQMIVNNPIIYPESPAVSPEVLDLMKNMLNKNPLLRIKLSDIKTHDWVTECGANTLINQSVDYQVKSIDVTEEEIANSIRSILKIETVMKIKMLLKHKSFRNPDRHGSVSKLESTVHSSLYDDNNCDPETVAPQSKSTKNIIIDGNTTNIDLM